MPVGDWQFWFVTLICLAAVAFVLRKLFPRKRSGTRVKLTIGAKEKG